MSEKEIGDRDSDARQETAEPVAAPPAEAAAEPAKDPTPRPAPPATPAQRGPGSLVIFALLIALAALGLSGWLAFETVNRADDERGALAGTSELAALETRLDALATQLAADSERQRSLGERQVETAARLDALRERLDSGLAAAERQAVALSERDAERLAVLDRAMDDLAGRLQLAVDDWAERGDLEREVERDVARQLGMLEAAALLSLGQHRAELMGDLTGARAAYRRAAAQLASIDDARLDRTRQALARELEALEAARPADLNAALARLERLASDSRAWPSQLGRDVQPLESERSAPGAEDTPWRERVADAARGLVRVQARDELGRTTEQFESARELMQLRLVAAQLALVRRDADGLRLQLWAAEALIDDWFDAGSPEVQRARQALAALAETETAPAIPEIGEALNLLQRRLGEP
ncbi:MAG: uroporphyrinogen-III C-methyltransferase [Wenzhouxiangella sp.]